MKRFSYFWALSAIALLLACSEEPVSHFMGPVLLANSPVHFGDSPQGVRQSGRLVITNGGDGPLKIADFQVTPDDGIFQIGVADLPLQVSGRRSKEIVVLFTPPTIGSFRAELAFDSNHEGDALSPIVLLGNGISNQVCLPCTPPPEPECHMDQTSSISFVPNQGTDCESEEGICSYDQIETLCTPLLCDPDTGLCPDAAPSPVCGDGNVEAPEECDDGNTNNGDGCSDSCEVEEGWDCTNPPCEPICGDGLITGNEGCDDGNTDNGDGCSASCSVEIGWDCSSGNCEAVCGDGQTLGEEECDDGNTDIENCDYGVDTCTVCGPDCTYVSGVTQTCGDGVVQGNEACDDGAAHDGGVGNSDTTPDACREDCTSPTCGDNVQDSNETCDDGNTAIEACDYGEASCTVCGNLCTLVPGVAQNCGDGILQDSEECDDGTAHDGGVGNSNNTADACRTNCVNASCGDGWVDSAEGCDDGNNAPGDGCGTDCLVEDGWDCNGSPSICTAEIPDAPGETCETATPILASSGSLTASFGSSNDYEPGDLATGVTCTGFSNSDGAEVLYSITMNSGDSLYVTASSTNNEHDIAIYILDECPPSANACVMGTDEHHTGVNTPFETLTFPWSSTTETEHTFYLVVDAFCISDPCPTSSDTFNLTWDLQ